VELGGKFNVINKKDIHLFREKHRILLQTKDFICLSPHPNLKEYISNYNITFPTRELMPNGFTSMPCGCATLVIENNNKEVIVYLEGPTSKPNIVGSHVNQLDMLFTIEFKPAGLHPFTGINQSDLTDEKILLDLVNPKLCRLISEIIEKAGNIYELVACLDILLMKNMNTTYPKLRPILQNIIYHSGTITVKNLSEDINYSERHLNRIFKQYVGLSAKSFSRIIRINNSFRLLKKPQNSLTLVSDLTGFYDLPHFIHDFKLVCGITPQEYRKNMSDFYNNTTKF